MPRTVARQLPSIPLRAVDGDACSPGLRIFRCSPRRPIALLSVNDHASDRQV
jgi:hypothetical protein